MRKLTTLLCMCLTLGATYSQTRLPLEYSLILQDVPIMAAKTYESAKRTYIDSVALKAFVPCDNYYYFFRRSDSVEYELLYVPGDDGMFLNKISHQGGMVHQTVQQFLFKEPKHIEQLDWLICFVFHL